jgi:hypothetical protein
MSNPTYVERKAVQPFRFENSGDSISGVLIEIDSVTKDGKANLHYTLHNLEKNRNYSFYGTMDLNRKIRRGDIGTNLQIQYEGMSEPEEGRKPMKLFKVLASTQ